MQQELDINAAVQKEFGEERDTQVQELETGYEKDKDNIGAMSAGLKEDMAAGFGGLEQELHADFKDIDALATETLPAQQEARVRKTEATIKKGMGDMLVTNEERSKEAGTWLTQIRAENAKGFQTAGTRLLSLEGELQGDERSLRAWDTKSARTLGAMDQSIAKMGIASRIHQPNSFIH